MAEKTGKKWIAKATEKNKGKFAKKAEKAGESTAAFAAKHAGDKGTLGKEARLAETLGEMRRRKLYTNKKG